MIARKQLKLVMYTLLIITLNCYLYQVQPLMIELVPGYGVRCTKRQRDEAVAASNSPTRLIRNLMPIFFSQSTLATHSCGGRGANPALDQDIVAACIGKLLVPVIVRSC